MKVSFRFKTVKIPDWTVPVSLLLLALLCFGPLIPALGFYWDDWAQLLAFRAFGANGFWAYFASDRPLSAWTHVLFSPVFGTSSPAWHLFTLGLRWLAAVCVWWLCREIWPSKRLQAVFVAFIFLVYPVFSQQSISVAYHQHWLQYLLFLFSLAAMVRAQRSSRQSWIFSGLALVAQGLQLSITEYFVGVELLRPILLWFVINRLAPLGQENGQKRSIWRVFLAWLPYLLVLSLYVYWRMFLLRIPGGDINTPHLLIELVQKPLAAIQQLVHYAFWDTFFILISNWQRVFALSVEQTSQPVYLAAWVAGAASAAGLIYYFVHLPDSPRSESSLYSPQPLEDPGPNSTGSDPAWRGQASLLGGLILLFGPAPVWALGGYILNDPDPYHADRYALGAMLGVALVLTVLIDWIGQQKFQKAVLAAALIGLAVSYHIRTANDFRWLWSEQADFFTQLAWRAPTLKPGTSLLTENLIFPFQGNFSTSAALNLVYPQTRLPQRVDYWVYALLPRYEKFNPEKGPASLQTNLRTFHFAGSTATSILVETGNPQQKCLWVLTPADRDNPYLSSYLKRWLTNSYQTQITASVNPARRQAQQLFGTQPETDWCSYYEKAELAAQFGNWSQVAKLSQEAQTQGFIPGKSPASSPREWVAFIEGNARSGNWQTASDITLAILKNDEKYRAMLCSLWHGLGNSTGATQGKSVATQVLEAIKCNGPE